MIRVRNSMENPTDQITIFHLGHFFTASFYSWASYINPIPTMMSNYRENACKFIKV